MGLLADLQQRFEMLIDRQALSNVVRTHQYNRFFH
jgi:hypothetical protein